MSKVREQSRKYKAFISYTHSDQKWALWLHRALEHYRLPKGIEVSVDELPLRRIAPVFLDMAELPATPELNSELLRALEASDSLIVICSPAAAASMQVAQEIDAYRRLRPQGTILPFIVGGRPNALARGGTAAEECFPAALADVSGSGLGSASLGADVRPGKGGRSEALLKLVAGILAINLDQLRQRDLRRRRRQWLAIAAACFSGMVGAFALGAYAWNQRGQAIRAEQRANLEAQSARDTTDFILKLFKVADPSESRGNSITAREILDRGAMELQTQLHSQPVIRARMMRTIGDVYSNLGLFSQSQALIEKALSELKNSNFGDTTEIAETKRSLGKVLVNREQYREAEVMLSEAIALFDANAELQKQSASARADLGFVYWSENDYKRAKTMLEEALRRTDISFGPNSSERAEILSTLGITVRDLGDPGEGLRLLQESAEIYRTIYGKDYFWYAMDLQDIGFTMIWLGRFPEAAESLKSANEILEHVLGPEHEFLGVALQGLGSAQRELRQYKDAEGSLKRSLAIFEKAGEGDSKEVGRTLAYLAQTYDAEKAYNLAISAAERSNEIGRLRFTEDSTEYGSDLQRYALILRHAGQIQKAEVNMRHALAILEKENDSPARLVSALNGLADILCVNGPNAEGFALANRALGIKSAATSTQTTIVRTTAAYCDPNRTHYEENVNALEDALRVIESATGTNSPQWEDARRRLATYQASARRLKS